MELLDKFLIVAGVTSFVIMTVAFRFVALQVYRDSVRFKSLNMVFNALSVMAGVFIFTAAVGPLYPDHEWLWRIVSIVPIFGVAFELLRFLWKHRND